MILALKKSQLIHGLLKNIIFLKRDSYNKI